MATFWGYVGLFFLSTVKFITAPPFAYGIPDNSFFWTWITVISGGIFGVTFFYFSAEFFMNRAKRKAEEKGIVKKKFTRMNKLSVRIKKSLGIYGLALLTASFLSIPIGAIITAKFYGGEKRTIFLLYAAIVLVGSITTFLTYLPYLF